MTRSLPLVVLAAGTILVAAGCGQSDSNVAGKTSKTKALAHAPGHSSVQTIPAADLAAMPVTGRCYLDKVNGQRSKQGFDVTAGIESNFVGWAVNAKSAAPAHVIFVLKAKQSYGLNANMGGIRPDVAKALDSKRATKSGFHVTNKLRGVIPGRYAALVEVTQPSGEHTLCDLQRYIRVSY